MYSLLYNLNHRNLCLGRERDIPQTGYGTLSSQVRSFLQRKSVFYYYKLLNNDKSLEFIRKQF